MKIDNFLIIKSADLEIGKITVFIGPQASGKSIIAKLIFFFKNFISSTCLESIQSLETKRQLDKKGLSDFEQYFPKYAWSKQEFEIIYSINEIEIKISQKINQRKNLLRFDYSKKLAVLHKKLKSIYKRKLNENKISQENNTKLFGNYDPITNRVIFDILFNIINNYTFKEIEQILHSKVIFIPANRSLFTHLQKNIFSFLANNIEIDPFLKYFGSHYEHAKKHYNHLLDGEIKSEDLREIETIVESILIGKYKYENGQDWIVSKNKKINLINASSGQQEVLPMLIILSILLFFYPIPSRGITTIFIEELEAHLFPVSQKHIMSLIALIYNRASYHFMLTTHSPYILVALNNMILAHDISVDGSETEVNKIIDKDFHIKFEDVSAYTINKGVVETILDNDSRLIGTNIIDSVSDEFNDVLDSLLQLQREKS